MTLEELKNLVARRESENIELKEWKSGIDFDGKKKFENRRCLFGYCVALGNEGGGYLIVGVKDDGTIVGTDATVSEKQKKKVYDEMGQKISADMVTDDRGRRVLVIRIPSRPMGVLLKFSGVPLMRVGESLEVMSDSEQTRILLEGRDDFSARVCESSSFEDIDISALQKLLDLYRRKHPENKTFNGISERQFLRDMGLITGEKLTYAGVILLARKEFLDRRLGDVEICFEYRNRRGDGAYNERIDYRKPFLLVYEAIWEKIVSRQQTHSFIEGMLRREIPAFNQEVFREALFNAVCHREYAQPGSIFIKQSPEGIEITNPGGFPFGVTKETVVTAPSTPRNRLLAEVFQKVLPGVERSGQGADKIFRLTIEEGKGMPDYSGSEKYFVRLFLPAMLQDARFVEYLEKIVNETQRTISLDDLMFLEKIRSGIRKGITLKTIGHLVERGFVELYGKTRGTKYVLARKYYAETGGLGERTRRIGLSRDKCKELILEHIRKNGEGKMSEFVQIFPELKRSDITNLLAELKKSGRAWSTTKNRWAVWRMKEYE